MAAILVTIGALIVLVSIAAVLRPRELLDLAGKIAVRTWLRVMAFLVRVVLGTILILVAPSTTFSPLIKIIGVLLIASGIAVLLLGNEGVQRVLNWALRLGPSAVVTGGLVGILFGAFLIYVAV